MAGGAAPARDVLDPADMEQSEGLTSTGKSVGRRLHGAVHGRGV